MNIDSHYESWLSTLADDPTPFDAFRAGFEAGFNVTKQRVSGVVDAGTTITMQSADVRDPTVGGFIVALSMFPHEYRLHFSPGECEDMTSAAEIAVLEGTTSDGPGNAWIKLKDDGR